VKASDLGGFTLLVVEQADDSLVVKDLDCTEGNIKLGMSRTADSVTFTRADDRCEETSACSSSSRGRKRTSSHDRRCEAPYRHRRVASPPPGIVPRTSWLQIPLRWLSLAQNPASIGHLGPEACFSTGFGSYSLCYSRPIATPVASHWRLISPSGFGSFQVRRRRRPLRLPCVGPVILPMVGPVLDPHEPATLASPTLHPLLRPLKAPPARPDSRKRFQIHAGSCGNRTTATRLGGGRLRRRRLPPLSD
jgi:hypothetical protein